MPPIALYLFSYGQLTLVGVAITPVRVWVRWPRGGLYILFFFRERVIRMKIASCLLDAAII